MEINMKTLVKTVAIATLVSATAASAFFWQ
jgi:hypothetical protein